MRLNKNMYSLNIFRSYSNSISKGSKALNNISTGKKINSAKDNPNKIGENESLKIQLLSTKKAEQNIQDTTSMIQTYDGAMQEMNDTLSRMKELAVKAKTGTLSTDDRNAIQDEIVGLRDGLKDLVNNTSFNGIGISDSSIEGLEVNYKKALVGSMESDTIDIPTFNISIENLGIDKLDVTKDDDCISKVDNAISMVSRVRGNYGAIQNSLEETAENISAKSINLTNAQSSIGDADIVKEYVKYSTNQILMQSSISLIAQANNIPQDALQIIGTIPR
ncbi:flagellin [uncultured Clostridium sp.]|uniref:flagellin n=1 Tax=uncultured Clostridium sp. TaxID=59620 RepID=UPI0025EA8120|nr:flagellin [uncultured Clostridium sp.]